ncbi:MAG: sulfatase-like hydrolase/transferase [Opitutaceae bacterium]|nr:sulfatase-like hydrolase/transferase [Opitutaceae bacterium]
MKRLLLLLFAVFAFAVLRAAESKRPNILLIVSDDQGYADAGFQGCKDIPTPHLDELARGGVVFTQGYVSHPFCSPTRAGLMTGRYQHRFGHENNPFYDPADRREGLPVAEKLLPEYLRAAGYVTGWVGKWHLGAAPEFRPERRGFAETFGFIGGGHRFQNWTANPAVEYMVPLERNGVAVAVSGHLTGVLGREAADFVRRHAAAPWFLYLAFNAPHTPHEPTAERLAQFAAIADPKRRAYAAQVSLLDDAIGETLAALRASGQAERTLVFFFSDNGGPIAVNGSLNTPLRDGKGSVYEGGVRVPFVLRWPAALPAGARSAAAVSALDVFATALAAAGAPMPADRVRDSVDLVPFITGAKTGAPHERLFWRAQRGQRAVRDAEGWKLVRQDGRADELYHLSADPGEDMNLAAREPDRVRALAADLAAWERELVPPAFPGATARAAAKAAKKKN